MDTLTGQTLVKKSRSAVNQCFIYLVINTFIIPKNAVYSENRTGLQSPANPSVREGGVIQRTCCTQLPYQTSGFKVPDQLPNRQALLSIMCLCCNLKASFLCRVQSDSNRLFLFGRVLCSRTACDLCAPSRGH